MGTSQKAKPDQSTDSNTDIILQAVHDIRSPLSVLRVLIARMEKSSEPVSRELISAVFQRIEDISTDLLSQCRGEQKAQALSSAVHSLIQEKEIEFGQDVKIQCVIDATVDGVRVEAREYKRALSNLMNNAVEAGAKSLKVMVSRFMDHIHLSVSDDGAGFPIGMLTDKQLGIEPGRGLGLRHAQNFAASLNGQVMLSSTPMTGSCITLALPAAGIYALPTARTAEGGN